MNRRTINLSNVKDSEVLEIVGRLFSKRSNKAITASVNFKKNTIEYQVWNFNSVVFEAQDLQSAINEYNKI